MAASRKLDTRAVGLDVALSISKFLTGRENLHYGLWRDGLEVCAANVGRAQEAYSDLLLSHLPKGKLRILDIGGGAGETARRLLDMGHSVEIVIPSALLAERCRVNTGGRATVHECKFEAFADTGLFDVCLFSESFQYIDLATALDKSAGLLGRGGVILIADCFRSEAYTSAVPEARVGGGHRFSRFQAFTAERGLKVLHEEDITADVAPSVEIEQAFFSVVGNAVGRLDEGLADARPFLRRVAHWVYRLLFNEKRRRRLAQRFMEETRTAENFARFNRYVLTVLQPAKG